MDNIEISRIQQLGVASQVMRDHMIDFVGTRVNPNGGHDLPEDAVAAVIRLAAIRPPIINSAGLIALRRAGIEV